MSHNAQNILIISSRADTGGGGEHYIKTIVENIDRARYNPIVALPAEGTFRPSLEKIGVEVLLLDSDHGWLASDKQWYQALAKLESNVQILIDFIEYKNIKLVHTNSNRRWEGVLAANLTGIHHIYAIRVDFDPDQPLYQRFKMPLTTFSEIMASLSTFILSVSQSCTQSLIPLVPQKKIRTINNGIKHDFYDAILATDNNSIRHELGIPFNSLLIIAVGRIVPDKGFDIYIDAAMFVLKSHPTAHFLIAGSADNAKLYDTLSKRVSQSMIGNNFHFLGFRNDIHKILNTSDIFILSSRHEGQSNALLEAMACQCAIVATRCSGVEDAIIDEQCGLVIDIDDSLAMATAIIDLLDNQIKLTRFAKLAKERIKSHFQIQDKINELMQLYDDALALPPPAEGSPAVRLFLNTANEIATLGNKNMELENRLLRIENLANLIQHNFVTNCIRSIKHYLTKRTTPIHAKEKK